MNIFSLSGLILGLTCLFLVIISEIKGKSLLHRVWSLFNIAVGSWGAGSFFIGRIKDPDVALLTWRFTEISVVFIAVFFLHTTYLICNLRNRSLLYFAYFQGFIFSLLSITSNTFFSGTYLIFGQFYYALPGVLFYVFFFIWMALVGYSQYCLFISVIQSRGKLRNQILYFAVGTILGFSGGLTNFFPHFGINFYPFGNFTIPIYCLIVTYAILRYRLLDISIAVTRTSIFVAVYSLILGLPLLIIYYLQNQLVGLLGVSWWIVPFLCSTALATLGPFLYIYFDKKAEERLLKEQKKYQSILKSASAGMIRIRNLDVLLKLIVYVVTKIVKIQYASVYLFDFENQQFSVRASRSSKESSIRFFNIDLQSALIKKLMSEKEPLVTEEIALWLRDDPNNPYLIKLMEELFSLNAALVVPSFVEDRLIGILVLGEKRSRELYSQDDFAVFSVLANQAALAIENAQFYEEIRKTQESLFQAEKMATIGTMADGLSHQINNRFHALSLIAGDAMDVLKTYDCSQCNEETRQIFNDLKNSLERIQANVLQGGEVVRGLLKYSRPGECGFERISFKEVLDGAVEMVSYKIKLREIDFVKDIPSDPTPKLNHLQREFRGAWV